MLRGSLCLVAYTGRRVTGALRPNRAGVNITVSVWDALPTVTSAAAAEAALTARAGSTSSDTSAVNTPLSPVVPTLDKSSSQPSTPRGPDAAAAAAAAATTSVAGDDDRERRMSGMRAVLQYGYGRSGADNNARQSEIDQLVEVRHNGQTWKEPAPRSPAAHLAPRRRKGRLRTPRNCRRCRPRRPRRRVPAA